MPSDYNNECFSVKGMVVAAVGIDSGMTADPDRDEVRAKVPSVGIGARVGKFLYDGLAKVDFEDRLLAHLQTVIGAKLRRGESFHFTWKDDTSIGDGRTIIWVHPGASIVYKFYGSRRPALNRAWIDALMYNANSVTGLYVVPEPPEEPSNRDDDEAR